MLSTRVSTALKLNGGPEAEESVKFAEMFDHFFDCLNVNSFDEGKHQRKPFKIHNYRSVKDFRLKVHDSLKLCIVRTSCMQCPSLLALIHIGVGSGGARGGATRPPPNFTHCLRNEFYCSIVDGIACRHCSSRKSRFCCLKKMSPPPQVRTSSYTYDTIMCSG